MDFGSLLYEAQENEKYRESRPNCYSTKFAPPKKVSKDRSKLSVNVQKFLEKREEDEKKKKDEDKKKLNELLALRNQDKKSVNRVNKMLKLTKSANKSVLDDEDSSEATMTCDKATLQPDEDDYGYTSQAAASLYSQLTDKYAKQPVPEPKFLKPMKTSVKNIADIKDRVKAALKKEEDDKLLPHKRKRKSKGDGGGDDEDRGGGGGHSDNEPDEYVKKTEEKEKEKVKPKKPMPPPMDFAELLKLAEKKQHEPIILDKKETEKEKRKEPERLMSKKERREYEAHVERKRRLMEQEKEKQKQLFRIPKKNGDNHGEKNPQRDSDRKENDRNNNKDKDTRKLEKSSSGGGKSSINSSSSSSSKPLSTEQIVEKLKKPSSLWNAPCNLTPPKLKPKFGSKYDSSPKNTPSPNRSSSYNDVKNRNGQISEKLSMTSSKSNNKNPLSSKSSRESSEKVRDTSDKDRVNSEKSRIEELERELLLLKYKQQQEEMKALEEKLKAIDEKKSTSSSPSRNNRISNNKNDDRLSNSIKSDKMSSKLDRTPPKNDFSRLNGTSKHSNSILDSRKIDSSSSSSISDRSKLKPTSLFNEKPKLSESSMKPKQFPPADVRPRMFPPADVRPKQFPPPDVRRMKKPLKRRIESDDEYDSELDDFIVDDDDAELDVSKEISNIFGYDRNRYRHMDDDDGECMESSFHRLEREEYESTKAGLLEDLQDIQNEKRQKALAAKRKKMKK